MLLIYNNPFSPRLLWEKFKSHLCEDFTRSGPANAEDAAYNDIDEILQEHNKNLQDLGIVCSQCIVNEDHCPNSSPQPDLWALLNVEQVAIGQEIIETIQRGRAKCFFIDGSGGTGKTFLYKALHQKCQQLQIPIICVGSTGIAATLLPDGSTAHSHFFDVNSCLLLREDSTESKKKKDNTIIIWDEGPMMNKRAFEMVDAGLRRLMATNELFDGKVIVIGGDFRQCSLVVRRGTEAQQIAASLKFSHLWTKMEVRRLQRNMRANSEEVAFKEWLLALPTNKNGEIEIPGNCIVQGDIIDDVFGTSIHPSTTDLATRVILAPLNEETIATNNAIVLRMDGEGITYKSRDEALWEPGEDPTLFPTEFLHTLTPSGLLMPSR